MYDELVKRLRDISNSDSNIKSNYIGLTMNQAADAIEERDRYALTLQHEMMTEAESHIALVERLNKQVEELQKQVAHWQRELAKSMCGETLAELEKPQWVPVTERLPDAYEDVMLKFPNNQAVGFVDRDGYWAVYSGDGFYTEVADNETKPTHWAKKLPEPSKEEA